MNTDQITLTEKDVCLVYLSPGRFAAIYKTESVTHSKRMRTFGINLIGLLAFSLGRFVFVLEGVRITAEVVNALVTPQ